MSDSQSASANSAVFLSYASQDAEVARRISEALRSGGVEVWFDADGGLEHGDEWDAKIRRQIKNCVLFIPIISANTQARHEGYFRIEWDLAAERARGIAAGVPFILPVVIDGTSEPDALVPDRFRAVQWTRLSNGTVPSEVRRRFLKLWSHRTGVLKHDAPHKEDIGSTSPAAGDPSMHVGRGLAAIVFTDVVSYSQRMQRDENGTLALVKADFALMREHCARHNGEVLNSMGDGLLMCFPSVVQAVTCALKIQSEFGERRASQSPGQALEHRMGVHIGDVFRQQDGGVAGDGVNIAARIQTKARPGTICLSQSAFDAVTGKLAMRTESLGPQLLKNIAEPIALHLVVPASAVGPTASDKSSRGVGWVTAVLAVIVLALTAFIVMRPTGKDATPLTGPVMELKTTTASEPAVNKKSIAVLPFDNFSSEKEKFEYFADGMTEQMISRLSRVSGLTVKARNAVMRYKGRDKDLATIGRELGVGTVLESSVRREGNQLRITVQLIDTRTLNHLWSQDFDETYERVLAIQSDVAERVAAVLKVELLDEEKRLIRRQPTANPEAFDYYLRGKSYFGTGREATVRSVEMLEKAISLDDTFAEAYAELSLAYSNLAYFLEGGNKELERKAEAAADKALRLNPDIPEAHLAQARILWKPSSGFQHEMALLEVHRALAIRSNLDEAHVLLGAILFHVGLIDESLEQFKKADEINPGNPTVRFELGVNELYHGRYENAVAMMEAAHTGFMRTFSTYRYASALLYAGRTNDARNRVEEACKKIGADPKLKDEGGILTAMQALFIAIKGDKTQAVEKIKEAQRLGEGFGHYHHTAHVIASVYSILGEQDVAIKWLRYAAENGYPNVTWFRRDPNLANLRKDQRFDALMAELQPRYELLKRLAETPRK